jgi:hypothetical protein
VSPTPPDDLESGYEVELELQDGTRVGGVIVDVDEGSVVLEASSHGRAPIRKSEIVEVVLVTSTEEPE